MYTTQQPAADAFLISISDSDLQAYLQSYPFLAGPDPDLNRRGLQAIRAGPLTRKAAKPATVTMLECRDLPIDPTVRAVAADICRTVQISSADEILDDFYWKIAVTGASPARILAFGCGGGDELIVLRAIFPHAILEAMDWADHVRPGLLEKIGAVFHVADLNEALDGPASYDLIFSNHTVEHLYDPDSTLRKLGAWLTPNGVLACGLPLDGSADDAFRDRLSRWAAAPFGIGALEMEWIDPGHPWKTNSADLHDTLKRAGFTQVRLYQRDFNIPRGQKLDEVALKALRRTFGRANRLMIAPAKAILSPFQAVRLLRKAIFAAMRRIPWGDGRFKNMQSREIAFVARRDA